MNLKELTIVEARAHMVKGTFSATEYVTELLRSEPDAVSLNAFVARDTGQMLKEAVAADASGASRNAAKLLAGIPIALKDNINTTGLPTTGCTGALKGKTPTENAPVARQLFDAGAILAGKNNMHELALGITNNNAVTGAARNPWQTDLIPGAAAAARRRPSAGDWCLPPSVQIPAHLSDCLPRYAVSPVFAQAWIVTASVAFCRFHTPGIRRARLPAVWLTFNCSINCCQVKRRPALLLIYAACVSVCPGLTFSPGWTVNCKL